MGTCAKAWPPLLTKGNPTAGSGVDASDLGTTMRSDGTEQVTYKGHPLYYFVADTSAGSTKGAGQRRVRRQVVAGRSVRHGDHRQRHRASTSSGGSSTSSTSSSSGSGWG